MLRWPTTVKLASAAASASMAVDSDGDGCLTAALLLTLECADRQE